MNVNCYLWKLNVFEFEFELLISPYAKPYHVGVQAKQEVNPLDHSQEGKGKSLMEKERQG